MASRQGLQRLLRSCPSLTGPRADASPEAEEVRDISNPRVLELAEQIVQLNLLEVSDLTEVLKKRLNIQPAAFGMPMGMPMAVQPSSSGGAGGEAAEIPKEEKTEFNLKLESYDAASKIKVIKEIRSITDLGLKEAKELVESSPAVIKKGLSKEAAEEIQKKLESVGGKVVLE